MKTQPHPSRIPCQKPAFTLTELLVTIVIIIIIATLSFTGLTRMRTAGDRVGATRSLSQIQLANAGYAADNNGVYAPIQIFDDKGDTYVPWFRSPQFLSHLKGEASIYKGNGTTVDSTLPLNMLDPATVRAKKKFYDVMSANFGYMTNGVPGGGWKVPNSRPSFKISQLTSPERSAVFATGTDWNVSYAHRFLWQGANAVEGFTPDQKMAYRHNGKALIAYYDGHVGEVSVADIKKIDTKGGASNIFWRGDAK